MVFEAEDMFTAEDRKDYRWADESTGSGHVRRVEEVVNGADCLH